MLLHRFNFSKFGQRTLSLLYSFDSCQVPSQTKHALCCYTVLTLLKCHIGESRFCVIACYISVDTASQRSCNGDGHIAAISTVLVGVEPIIIICALVAFAPRITNTILDFLLAITLISIPERHNIGVLPPCKPTGQSRNIGDRPVDIQDHSQGHFGTCSLFHLLFLFARNPLLV